MSGTFSGLEPCDQDCANPIIAVGDELVHSISGPSTDFGMFHEPAWVAGEQPWCRMVRLHRVVGRLRYPLWLIYVVGNCIEIYQNLFIGRNSAPKILWLECPLGVDMDRWAEFVSPAGEFGAVFSTAVHQPKYIVAQRSQPGWQQTVPYKQFKAWHPAWDLTMFKLPDVPGK
jgi:hypothetical protein